MTEYNLRLLDRIVAILDCFTPERPRWTLSQLERELPLSKSTTFRILQSLEQHRLVQCDPVTQQYVLGPRIRQFNRAVVTPEFNIREVARPYLERMRDALNETAGLYIRVDDQRLCVEQVESHQSIRRVLPVGIAYPLYPSTSGKLFLAYEDPDRARAILSTIDIQPTAKHTITDLDELMCELRRTREQGYSTSVEESLAGAWTISAPVHQPSGKVEWAIAVSGPMTRYSPDGFSAAVGTVVAASRDLTMQIASTVPTRPGPAEDRASLFYIPTPRTQHAGLRTQDSPDTV